MVGRSVVMPIGISPKEWAAQLRIDWSQDDIPEWTDQMTWQEWGQRLVNQSTALKGAAPFPAQFDTFEEWAFRVFQATN